ncbi:phosphonate C-P lyase system protein PhnL [Marinibaculum pumilum]|uniref:Phosphonate C-P lyase system protein PhnL n=1 Tax=Marinibaculum pumilum TaxID=1766165 RepID=A0ABV7L1S8_9PROT
MTATMPAPAAPGPDLQAGADVVLSLRGVAKSFTLHLRGGTVLPVLADAGFDLAEGECLLLAGPSGAGKSSLLKMIYGNYRVAAGSIRLRHDGAMVDIATAGPRQVLEIRRRTLGYVSQFLRVIPRVPVLDVVAEPALAFGMDADAAKARARDLLRALNLPERLWSLPPATFSGGEQQRVNIARGLAAPYPVLLLDEPTASLDAENRAAVVALLQDALARGAAMVAIVHDDAALGGLPIRRLDVTGFAGGYEAGRHESATDLQQKRQVPVIDRQ